MEPRDEDGVWSRLATLAARAPHASAIVHRRAGEPPLRWKRAELLAAAGRAALALSRAGVRPGEVAAIVSGHAAQAYPLWLGILRLGALPAFLAPPNARTHPDKLRAGLLGMCRRSGLDWVLCERALEPGLGPLLRSPGSQVRGVLPWLEDELPEGEPPPPAVPSDPEQPCLLQHSSGTTGLQKAVVLSHRALLEHARRYGDAIGIGPEDRVVSWLPLYHDMGLVAAFLLPLLRGVPTTLLDPFEWVVAPELFLRAVTEDGGTLAWWPNFAYELTARRVRAEELNGVRLDGLRLLINCSEPVRAASHEALLARLAPLGLRAEALGASWAMAEATFAVTQTRPGTRARELTLDDAALGEGRAVPARDPARARRHVSSGRPIEGCAVRVEDEQGREVAPGRTGELVVASASLFAGYRHDPQRTGEVLRDGWYRTGDLGFVHEGEVYVIGRLKDLIIVAGRNVHPEDVEDAAAGAAGVVPGRLAAFGREDEEAGTEEVCLIVETDAVGDERGRLRLALLEAVGAAGLTLGRVYFAPRRWLVKSSSGKLSRQENGRRALAELEWA